MLTRDAAEDVFRTVATESAAQRAHNPGLEPGRVDVIVGGASVLVGIFRVLGFDAMLVSEADILQKERRYTQPTKLGARSRHEAVDHRTGVTSVAH